MFKASDVFGSLLLLWRLYFSFHHLKEAGKIIKNVMF